MAVEATGRAAAVPGDTVAARPLPPVLFFGFAVASIGGPLALPTLMPSTAGAGIGSAPVVVAAALAVFAFPLAIWISFSRSVVTPGGLSAFVQAAAGRRAAVAHGWIWAFAYFLYLPYTVTFVVYDLLPPVFPGVVPYRASLELLLPVALVGVALAPTRALLGALGLLGAVQLALLAALGGVELSHAGATAVAAAPAESTVRGVGATSLLFVCASLPLYLGGEVRGGARTVRRLLPAAVAVVGAAFLFAAVPLAAVSDALRDAPVPGAAIGQAYGGRGLGVAIGLVTALGTLALIVAEYLALARLLHWLHGPPVRSVLAWIAPPFVLLDVLSLAGPERFYSDLLKPSLAALFAAQLGVFAAFPRFRRGLPALGAAAVASALAVYGLVTLFTGAGST